MSTENEKLRALLAEAREVFAFSGQGVGLRAERARDTLARIDAALSADQKPVQPHVCECGDCDQK